MKINAYCTKLCVLVSRYEKNMQFDKKLMNLKMNFDLLNEFVHFDQVLDK